MTVTMSMIPMMSRRETDPQDQSQEDLHECSSQTTYMDALLGADDDPGGVDKVLSRSDRKHRCDAMKRRVRFTN